MILAERGRGILSNAEGMGKGGKGKTCKIPPGDYVITLGNSAKQDLQ